MSHRVTAYAGGAKYEVLIGRAILADALRREEVGSYERVAVIASARVYDLHREYLEESLGALGGRSCLILMDDRELNKSYAAAGRFLDQFIEIGMNRKSAVIGVGGGVVGDFAGYCAGVYMRGIPIIHVSTTLLAMVDSSIGGKVAVNLSVGKNIVGLFHQPSLVVSDTRFLDTLPDIEFRNGLTEALKHGLIGERKTLRMLERNDMDSIKNEDRILGLVARSVSFKSKIVQRDERERDVRAILNFGHTVGHAIESFMEYRGVSHGGAVATGIQVMVGISRRLGLISGADADRANRIIASYGLMLEKQACDLDGVIKHMEYDKKNFGDSAKFVLLKGLGNPIINQRIPLNMLREVMAEVIC